MKEMVGLLIPSPQREKYGNLWKDVSSPEKKPFLDPLPRHRPRPAM